MGYVIVEVACWILDIRGHIPQFGDDRPLRRDVPAGIGIRVARILAGIVVGAALLALALWIAVWLAIRLL
jgi:hypothetical protein